MAGGQLHLDSPLCFHYTEQPILTAISGPRCRAGQHSYKTESWLYDDNSWVIQALTPRTSSHRHHKLRYSLKRVGSEPGKRWDAQAKPLGGCWPCP